MGVKVGREGGGREGGGREREGRDYYMLYKKI